ncbi:MAG: hypothetical protein Kow0031_13010 [Anaerolineae bacterium]
MILTLELLSFGLAVWLGLYLMARDLSSPQLRTAGLGLLFFALSMATGLLLRFAPSGETAQILARLHWPMLFLPGLFWLGTIIYLLPPDAPAQEPLKRVWVMVILPVAVPVFLISAGANLVFNFDSVPPRPGPAYPLFVSLLVLPLLGALALVAHTTRVAQPKKPLGLLLAATIFVGLGVGLLIYPFNWLPRSWLLVGISFDFVLLGIAVAWLDAFDQGETLLADFARSFDAALLFVLLFGGLVAQVIIFGTGLNFAMLLLLLGVVTAAIFTQTFGDAIQSGLDRLAFAAFPRLRQARRDLRTTAELLPRINTGLNPAALNDEEFNRLTRRALSDMGNLPRLATNPLTRLPLVTSRLSHRNGSDDTLERAAELKRLLTEIIEQLKPPEPQPFDTTDAWRHYNALYFPYVAGLKPYSRRAGHDDLDETSRAALDWFRTSVPERTLYNWQTAAARLVAQSLRERLTSAR